jgi:hypothetical protein
MISILESAFPAARHGGSAFLTATQPTLFERERTTPSNGRASDAAGECSLAESTEDRIAWTQDEVVMLHGILFDTCVERLNDPETPLDEVVDCLRWIFSDRSKEAQPFSFSNTMRLYQRPHARYVREVLQTGLKGYLTERLTRYPRWVAEAFWSDPDRFADELERNPQWINERVRRLARDGDLFAA